MLWTSLAQQIPAFLGTPGDVPLAYLDPGTGSLMLQVLIAGLFSGLFFLKSSFTMVRGTFMRHFK
jgi:hypothetical protein